MQQLARARLWLHHRLEPLARLAAQQAVVEHTRGVVDGPARQAGGVLREQRHHGSAIARVCTLDGQRGGACRLLDGVLQRQVEARIVQRDCSGARGEHDMRHAAADEEPPCELQRQCAAAARDERRAHARREGGRTARRLADDRHQLLLEQAVATDREAAARWQALAAVK